MCYHGNKLRRIISCYFEVFTIQGVRQGKEMVHLNSSNCISCLERESLHSWPPFEAFLSNAYFLFSLFAIVSSPSIIVRYDWSWYSHVIIICKKVCTIGKNRLIFYESFVGILRTHTETTWESHDEVFQSWRLCTLLLQLHAVTDCHFSAGFNVFLIHRNLYAPVPSPTFV